MRRLYLQIYATFLGIVVLFGLLASLAWWIARDDLEDSAMIAGIGGVLGELLPPDIPIDEARRTLARLGRDFNARITLRTREGDLVAAAGEPLADVSARMRDSGWVRGRGPTYALALADGRWVIARPAGGDGPFRGSGFLVMLALLVFAIGLGAYPLVRRTTGRLERLQARVDALGAGDLSARVLVEGKDEVAALARSFNRAAERIHKLVEAQKSILASASHELRTPLARIRMAVELLAGDERTTLRDRAERDIAELDDLIEEVLLASRLDSDPASLVLEEIDLLGLVAEEAARHDAEIGGTATTINGDPRLLRRLVRNLLENANRHGGGTAIDVSVEPQGAAGAVLRVMDSGPGVPEADRERIFEPFYRRPDADEGADRGVGLGLALVRQIARRHGGDVSCRPRDGGGTCFEATLHAE